MKAKVFTKIGALYVEIHEEDHISEEDLDKVIAEWKDASVIEIFDNDGNLVFVYDNC